MYIYNIPIHPFKISYTPEYIILIYTNIKIEIKQLNINKSIKVI